MRIRFVMKPREKAWTGLTATLWATGCVTALSLGMLKGLFP